MALFRGESGSIAGQSIFKSFFLFNSFIISGAAPFIWPLSKDQVTGQSRRQVLWFNTEIMGVAFLEITYLKFCRNGAQTAIGDVFLEEELPARYTCLV